MRVLHVLARHMRVARAPLISQGESGNTCWVTLMAAVCTCSCFGARVARLAGMHGTRIAACTILRQSQLREMEVLMMPVHAQSVAPPCQSCRTAAQAQWRVCVAALVPAAVLCVVDAFEGGPNKFFNKK